MPDNEFRQGLQAYGKLAYIARATWTTTTAGAIVTSPAAVTYGVRSLVLQATGLYRLTLAHSARNLFVLISQGGAAGVAATHVTLRAKTASTGVIDIATVAGGADTNTSGLTIDVVVFEDQK